MPAVAAGSAGSPVAGDRPGLGDDRGRLAGLGHTEGGVAVQGAPPVLAPGVVLPGGVAGAGQTVVGTGLLVTLPRPAGHGERGGVARVGLPRLAGGQQGFPGTEQRLGFAAGVTDLLAQGQRLLVTGDGLIIVALLMADLAEPGQGAGLLALAAGLPGQGERAVVEGAGLLMQCDPGP